MAEDDKSCPAAEEPVDRECLLRQEYHAQTAKVRWHEVQVVYARGMLVTVAPTMDLVEVAVQLGMDNTEVFTDWIEGGSVSRISDELAEVWNREDRELWAVVAPPWVLVQPI
ncbi:MAG: DUF2288 family protein [Pseudomonadota bacterium]